MGTKANFSFVCLLLVVIALSCRTSEATTPIVLWHGMGDSCCNPLSLGSFMSFLSSQLPDVYMHSLQFGDGIVEDTMNGFFGNVNSQVDEACQKIQADEKLQQGYNSIGFSQGGQFLRAVAQRCPNPPMKNLISFGGQHQGVYGLPHCPGTEFGLCDKVRELLNMGAYLGFVQDHVVQAEYWHDPLNEAEYKEKSVFLADINNERAVNKTYIENLQRLEKLVLVKFLNDTMVQPKESEWFGFYKPGQAIDILPMRNTSLFVEDRLGLKAMDKQGKMELLGCEGDHLQFTDSWFTDNILHFLK